MSNFKDLQKGFLLGQLQDEMKEMLLEVRSLTRLVRSTFSWEETQHALRCLVLEHVQHAPSVARRDVRATQRRCGATASMHCVSLFLFFLSVC